MNDKYYMKEALLLGEEALKQGEVPVGCIIINEKGEIIAKGRNHTKEYQDGTQHAELLCIDQLIEKGIDMTKCILYVTCEPCIMCAEALRQCKLTKIIYGCSNSRFGGCKSTFSLLPTEPYPFEESHKSEIITMPEQFCYHSFMEKEGLDLLQRFFSMGNPSAPESNRKKRRRDEE